MSAPESIDAFRQRARAWLKENLPPRPADFVPYGEWERDRELQRKLHAGGFAGISWPAEYGGLGLPIEYQRAFDEESMGYEMPLGLNVPTFGICGATVLEFGTEAQKQRFIPPMLRGDEIWVQFLSEPTCGSDLASLTTRATLEGDTFLLNGSKVWSSGAHAADYAVCVARTNWSVPKHDGLTVMIVEIQQPGITVDQIIDTRGGAEFCQEFFDDARVPADYVLGEVDAGWTVVRGLLAHERNSVGGASPYTSGRHTGGHEGGGWDLISLARQAGRLDDPRVHEAIAQNYVLEFVGEHLKERVTAAMTSGAMPPTAGALLRMMSARSWVERSDLALEIAGASVAAWGEGSLGGETGTNYVARQGSEIGGGTTEIQRNIISERLLGMPREHQADRGVPFDQVRHNTSPSRQG